MFRRDDIAGIFDPDQAARRRMAGQLSTRCRRAAYVDALESKIAQGAAYHQASPTIRPFPLREMCHWLARQQAPGKIHQLIDFGAKLDEFSLPAVSK